MTLEQRLAQLEKEVAELKEQISAQPEETFRKLKKQLTRFGVQLGESQGKP